MQASGNVWIAVGSQGQTSIDKCGRQSLSRSIHQWNQLFVPEPAKKNVKLSDAIAVFVNGFPRHNLQLVGFLQNA